MNGTIGRGTTVHGTNGNYADCGKGMGRNAISATTAPVDCKACPKPVPAAPVKSEYKVTYQVNSLARGWVTKTVVIKGTEQWATAKIAELMNTSGYRVLTSEKI